MVTLQDSIIIHAPGGRIEEWLLEIEKHYTEWHPDHIKWVNLEGSLEEGKTFYYEEYLKGRLYKSRCRITKLERNAITRIEFAGLSIPDRILGVKGSFLVESREEGSLVTATLSMRFGFILRKLGIYQAILSHMKEEG